MSTGQTEAEGIGHPNVWGFSPAIDLLDNLYVEGNESSPLFKDFHTLFQEQCQQSVIESQKNSKTTAEAKLNITSISSDTDVVSVNDNSRAVKKVAPITKPKKTKKTEGFASLDDLLADLALKESGEAKSTAIDVESEFEPVINNGMNSVFAPSESKKTKNKKISSTSDSVGKSSSASSGLSLDALMASMTGATNDSSINLNNKNRSSSVNTTLLNVLCYHNHDPRHIITTASMLDRWTQTSSQPEQQQQQQQRPSSVCFDLIDPQLCVTARNLVLLAASYDCCTHSDTHAELLLEVWCNLRLRRGSVDVMRRAVATVLDMVQHYDEYTDDLNNSNVKSNVNVTFNVIGGRWLSRLVDLSQLRHKERDEIEQCLKQWLGECTRTHTTHTQQKQQQQHQDGEESSDKTENDTNPSEQPPSPSSSSSAAAAVVSVNASVKTPSLRALWEHRLRQFFGIRYDHRTNLYDYDYHFRLIPVMSLIHAWHYKRWRESGQSYERTGVDYDVDNTSLLTHCDARERDGKRLALRGYWGDILCSPYACWGVDGVDRDLFLVQQKQHVRSTVVTAEVNLRRVIVGLQKLRYLNLPKTLTVEAHKAKMTKKDETATVEEVTDNDSSSSSSSSFSSSADVADATVTPLFTEQVEQESIYCKFPNVYPSFKVRVLSTDALERPNTLRRLSNRYHRVISGYTGARILHLFNQTMVHQGAWENGVFTIETLRYTTLTKEQKHAFITRIGGIARKLNWCIVGNTPTLPTFSEQEDKDVNALNNTLSTSSSVEGSAIGAFLHTLPLSLPMKVYTSSPVLLESLTPQEDLTSTISFNVPINRVIVEEPISNISNQTQSQKQLLSTFKNTTLIDIVDDTSVHSDVITDENDPEMKHALQSLSQAPLGPQHTNKLLQLKAQMLSKKEKKIVNLEANEESAVDNADDKTENETNES